MTRNTKLVDAINVINEHAYNNVIELSIIDEEGRDVTTTPEAYEITLGCVFPGVYFMGRKESACVKRTSVSTKLVLDEDDAKPYTTFTGSYFQDLTFNSDVASEYPIYYNNVKQMRETLLTAGVTMKEPDDYLKEAGVSNRAFLNDDIDYEESSLTPFDLYRKLGEGYAVTAVAEPRVDGNGKELLPKVKEAPLDDPQRILPVGEGAYSTLQDARIYYHVLAGGFCADQEIGGKIPKAAAFKTTLVNDIEIMNGLVSVKPKVDENDATAAKKYTFAMAKYDLAEKPIELSDETLYRDGIATMIGFAADTAEVDEIVNAKPGDLLVCEGSLYVANAKGKFTDVVDKNNAGSYTDEEGVVQYGGKLYVANGTLYSASVVEEGKVMLEEYAEVDKPFMLVESIGKLFLASVEGPQVTLISEYSVVVKLNKDEDAEHGLFVSATSNVAGENQIMIQGIDFDSLTMNDFVEQLNESALGKLFTFALTSAGIVQRDEYVAIADKQAKTDAVLNGNQSAQSMLEDAGTVVLEADRSRGYDYSKHIPYYTTDNFARQLAQHCTYTELKTGPARGIIGCKRVSDLSKTAMAKKVAELKAKNWDLYVKNAYGRNMLNSDNLPYPIGRNVSICFFQNRVTTPSDYVQICNGATAYAGMISNLPLGQSPTAQSIDLVPMFELTHSQLVTMSQAGYVTVKNTFTKGYVITDGITMAPSEDLLQRIFNTRVMGHVEDILRAACEPFIGKGNTIANRNSLVTAIDAGLSKITEKKNGGENCLLRDYEFHVRNDDTVEQYTYIDIDYSIIPVNEIRNINNHIRVTK